MENKEKTNQITYSDAEQAVLNNCETMFNVTVDIIKQAKSTLAHAWQVKKHHDKEVAKQNPWSEFVKMLQWYIDKCNSEYGNYCEENGLPIDPQIKQQLDVEEQERLEHQPAKIEHLKPVKKLSME